MKFNKIYFIVFSILLTSFSVFSQEKINGNEKSNLPISIYTIIDNSVDFNRLYSINNRLNFKSYEFVFLDKIKLKEGYFTNAIEKIGSTPSMFIYETYMDVYNKQNLEKSFFKVSDLYKPYIPHK